MAHKRLPRQIGATLGVTAVYVLAIGYFSSASALQEDLHSPARYVAMNARDRDAIALPDHAIGSAVEYYLSGENRHIPLWPQLGVRQPYVEGFDLSLTPSWTTPSWTGGRPPHRVWLVTDGSVPRVDQFEATLVHSDYALVRVEHFTGVTLLLYQSWRT
jgi:hypothetical protein